MSTVFDLAERHGVSVDRVRTWLKRKGLIKRGEDRVSSAAEEQFRRAHGGQVMLEVAFAAPAPAPTPLPGARSGTRLDRAPGLKDQLQAERYYKKQHDALHAAYLEAQARAAAAEAEVARLTERLEAVKAEHARAERPRSGGGAQRTAPALPSLSEALGSRGVEPAQRALVVLSLLADEARSAELLAGLQVADPAPLDALRRVCGEAHCQAFATAESWLVVAAQASADCAVCGGRGNQRAFRWMASRLHAARRPRLLVVGGSEPSHADLKALNGLGPSLRLTLVDGTIKGTSQQARSRCRGADVVVIWGSSRLDHAVSDIYRAEARASDQVVLVSLADGARGVQSLAHAVLAALG